REVATLRARYEDASKKAEQEITALRAELREAKETMVPSPAGDSSELESQLAAQKRRVTELEAQVERLSADKSREEKKRERMTEAMAGALEEAGQENAATLS